MNVVPLTIASLSKGTTSVFEIRDKNGNMSVKVSEDGYVGVGNDAPTAPLEVNGTIRSGSIMPSADSAHSLGSAGNEWAGVYADTVVANAVICRAIKSTAQGPVTTEATVAWDSTSIDTENGFTTGSSAKYTSKRGGCYHVNINIGVTGSRQADDDTTLSLYKDGTFYSATHESWDGTMSGMKVMHLSDIVYRAVNSYISVTAQSDRAMTINNSSGYTNMTVHMDRQIALLFAEGPYISWSV